MASTNKYYDGSKILTKEEVTQMFVEAMGDDGKRTHDDGELWAHSEARFAMRRAKKNGKEFTRKFWCEKLVEFNKMAYSQIPIPTWMVTLANNDEESSNEDIDECGKCGQQFKNGCPIDGGGGCYRCMPSDEEESSDEDFNEDECSN
eukprot:SAG31_NODE_14836_length_785_cov_1.100583_2_plen_147_part_00